MKTRLTFTLIAIAALTLGFWAQSDGQSPFTVAQVATTFVDLETQSSARNAIKSGIERYGGTLDIAVSDFTDTALQFVLIRLSNDRPIRLLLGRGGVDPEAETEACDQLNELFEVRLVDQLNHRFAVVDGRSVVTSAVDWTNDALSSKAQAVIEIDSMPVADAYTQQFNALWQTASGTCSNRLDLP